MFTNLHLRFHGLKANSRLKNIIFNDYVETFLISDQLPQFYQFYDCH